MTGRLEKRALRTSKREEESHMKVVGVISSPHPDGSGAALVREALRGAKESGSSVIEVFLPRYRIEFCRDCRACTSSGACHIPDDFQEVRSILSEADGIIFSSPTYGAGMCARAKALFDRLGQYAYLTSSFGGKYVAGISTASSFAARQVAVRLAASIQNSVFQRAYRCGVLGVHLHGTHASGLPMAMRRACALGRKMANAIRQGRTFPLQSLATRLPNALVMRPMIKRGIVQNKDVMKGVYEELVRKGILAPS